ncbi:MAG: tetratricopeptide repeat protein, partial [Candidatus Cloacimonetes bacterium]|nr:tetratricopeptide repeat protein [Candidatus Cloacimonadota bacterium]
VSEISESARKIASEFVSVRDGSSAQKVVEAALSLLEEPSRRATMVISVRHQSVRDAFTRRYGSRYNLFFHERLSSNPFAVLSELKSQITDNEIIYIDGDWNPSPMLPELMLGHMREDKDLVYPLRENDGGIDFQQLQYYVKLGNNISPELTGWQLTYSMPGVNHPAQVFQSPVFAVSRAILEAVSFTNIQDEKLCWLELHRQLHLSKRESCIALDCYIDKQTNPFIPVNTSDESPSSINDLLAALENDPDNQSLLLEVIRWYAGDSNYDAADVYLSMISDETDPELNYYRAYISDKHGQTESALQHLDRVDILMVTETPLLIKILVLKGKLLLKSGNLDNAERYINEAYKLDKNSPVILIARSTLFMLRDEAEKASALLIRVLEQEKDYPEAHLGLGLIALSRNNLSEATSRFIRVLEINPTHLKALSGLIQCVYASGEFSSAFDPIEKYLKHKPNDTNVLFSAAGLFYQAENHTEARKQLALLMDIAPEFPGAIELQMKLERL